MSERLRQVRDILTERGLDAMLVTHPANRIYLSGFTAEDVAPNSLAGILLISAADAILMTGSVNVAWATAEAPAFESIAWTRPWTKPLAEQIRTHGWTRLGFEDHAIQYATHCDLVADLNGATELVPIGDAIDRLRAIKSPAEIATLTAAIELTDAVFVDVTKDLQPGTTERALAWRIEREIRERGAEGISFPPIVASGPHGARPHHSPGDRPLAAGEPIVIDMGARLGGYHADLTRTVWIGDADDRLGEVYGVVLAAQQAALGVLCAGVTGKDADAAARAVVVAAGFGDYFTHGLGHGVGLRIHEAPTSSETSEDVLQAGQVLTVEPGVYIPDWGGVRIEDVGVLEADGFRVLTRAPKVDVATGGNGTFQPTSGS